MNVIINIPKYPNVDHRIGAAKYAQKKQHNQKAPPHINALFICGVFTIKISGARAIITTFTGLTPNPSIAVN